MSLPTRLGLPDGVHELPTAVPAGQLSGLWPGSAAAAEAAALPPSATTPHLRLRRRALLRADPGLPDRPVLIEWFARADLDAAEAARRQGACHVNLLRLHHIGVADARTAYAISEAPAGVDLHTVCRAAPEKLPAWWAVAVVAAAARGLGALHQHLQRRGGTAHGGIELGTLFVAWSGAVQLLAYAPPVLPSLAPTAPEVLAAPRLITPAADVYALGAVLRALLPQAALARGPLQRLVRRCLLPHADERPALPAVQAALEAALWELDAPLGRAAAIGELLGRVCPRAATVDLADAEWGDSALASFATLPATLFPLNPLSTGAVPLSPTWVTAAPEPTVSPVPPPAPRSSRRTLVAGAAALGAALLGSGALWLAGTSSPAPGAPGSAQLAPSGSGRPAALLAGSPPAPPGPSSAATAGSSLTVAPSPLGLPSATTAGSSPTATPSLLGLPSAATAGTSPTAAPASVPLIASASSLSWGALRLQILRVTPEADRLRVQLRLTNPGPRSRPAPLSDLTIGPVAGRRQPPAPPPPLTLGAGRTAVLTLDYPGPPAGDCRELQLQLLPL